MHRCDGSVSDTNCIGQVKGRSCAQMKEKKDGLVCIVC